MINGIGKVGLEVEDQDRAKRFWTATMGFELVQDSPYGEGERWLEVRTPDKAIVMVLSRRHGGGPSAPDMLPTSNLFFYTDDLRQAYQELSAKGVSFPQAPVEMELGWWSMFEDQEGNRFALVPRGQ